jgi:vancomycin permeability regulator SanA
MVELLVSDGNNITEVFNESRSTQEFCMSIEVALQDVFMEFASHKTGGLNNNAQHEFLISIDLN